MAINPLAASLPAVPIADPSGAVNAVWRGFFLALQARTGGGAGASMTDARAQIAAFIATVNTALAGLAGQITTEATARAAADAIEQANRIAADAVFAEKIAGGGPAVDAETAARIAGDAQSRGFAFFMAN